MYVHTIMLLSTEDIIIPLMYVHTIMLLSTEDSIIP